MIRCLHRKNSVFNVIIRLSVYLSLKLGIKDRTILVLATSNGYKESSNQHSPRTRTATVCSLTLTSTRHSHVIEYADAQIYELAF